tara:strand:- start:10118 stop:10471 length:354 start_codon:yes stop_codon:yes gene_type:complete
MAIKVPQRCVLNWYDHDVSRSLEIIESFVDGVEVQVDESIARYEKEKESVVLDETVEECYQQEIDIHQGLNDQAWDLDSIFKSYFPSLQRRSALLTICGYFEHELDKLCHLYQSEKN